MKLLCGIIATTAVCMLLLSGCSPKASESVVLEVGQKKVTLGEYEEFFTKNSGGSTAAKQSSMEERNRFLDLLTNYKLKLQDASDRNMMNDPEIISEMKEYRQTLAATFLVDKEVTEPGVRQLYERRREELRAQHILFSVKADAPPADTLKAYEKAMDIIRRAKSGESFDSLARKFSEDPSVKANGGDVYYFSSGQMVSSFENAAYAMKQGEISSVPVRSPFGYHVVRLTERHPAPGAIRVRHIMTLYKPQGATEADTAGALARIKAFQDSLKKGMDFVQIATKHSEDLGTANRGGDLGWVERKRYVQQFDEAAFKLKLGIVSDIVQTPFGFHLIRIDSVRPVPPFTQVRDELKKQYQQSRFNEDYQNYIANLKKKFSYTFNDNAFNAFVAVLDSNKTTEDSAWDASITPDIEKMALMNVNNRAILIDTVLSILRNRPELRNTSLARSAFKTQLGRIAEGILLEEHAVGLEQRNADFRSLMNDYNDGILLYKAEQVEVWGKTVVSDSALKAYYAQNRSKFIMPEKVNMAEMYFETDTLALMVYDSLTRGGDFASFAGRYHPDPDMKAKGGETGFLPVTESDLTQKAATMKIGEISDPIEIEGGYAIIKLLGKEPSREKTFEEAGPEVSNAYQEYEAKRLEQIWLESIKQRHPVKQYREYLQNAFASPDTSR